MVSPIKKKNLKLVMYLPYDKKDAKVIFKKCCHEKREPTDTLNATCCKIQLSLNVLGRAIVLKSSVHWVKLHCLKNVRIWSFSGLYFPTFRLNTERTGFL